MSWWEYLFDSDLQQRTDINRQSQEISNVENSVYDLESRIKLLESENTELKVICRALVQTLVDRELTSKESFVRLVREIDTKNYWANESIFPPKQSQSAREPIEIDFSSARQKPESFND